jgi:hypothetical protein
MKIKIRIEKDSSFEARSLDSVILHSRNGYVIPFTRADKAAQVSCL